MSNKQSTFQLGFINTSDTDITFLLSLKGLHVQACTEQKVTFPLPRDRPAPAGQINQLAPDPDPSPTRQYIIIELNLHKKVYLLKHPKVKSQLMSMVHRYAESDVFTPKSGGNVGETELLKLELKMAPGSLIKKTPRPLNPV